MKRKTFRIIVIWNTSTLTSSFTGHIGQLHQIISHIVHLNFKLKMIKFIYIYYPYPLTIARAMIRLDQGKKLGPKLIFPSSSSTHRYSIYFRSCSLLGLFGLKRWRWVQYFARKKYFFVLFLLFGILFGRNSIRTRFTLKRLPLILIFFFLFFIIIII